MLNLQSVATKGWFADNLALSLATDGYLGSLIVVPVGTDEFYVIVDGVWSLATMSGVQVQDIVDGHTGRTIVAAYETVMSLSGGIPLETLVGEYEALITKNAPSLVFLSGESASVEVEGSDHVEIAKH